MKKKLITILLAAIMLSGVFTVSASAYNRDLVNSITANYNTALSMSGRNSFYGRCNLATAYQLKAMGIYKGQLDFSGSGNLWYGHFKNINKTSGGYNVITISGKNCLYDLIEQYGNEIYNIVYSLGTGGSSGPNHAMYIRAIIDGYVYFADSFANSYNGRYYPEGSGTVLPLDTFIAAYRRMNGNPYGCIYFAKNDNTEHYSGSSETPDGWVTANRTYIPGEYIITSDMLQIRKRADSDSQSLGLLQNNDKVSVTEVRGKWGKIRYDSHVGWIHLDYALRLSITTEKISDSAKADSPESVASDLRKQYLSADRPAVFSGTDVTWTARTDTGKKEFYAFYIYRDGIKIYNGTFSSDNTFTYTLKHKGSYQASVTIIDDNNNSSILYSDNVICVGEKHEHLNGDRNGDSRLTSADARIAANKIAENIDNLTGKNFICNGFDKNGILTSQDAKLRLKNSDEPVRE